MLALDLGTKCGWALYAYGKITSGTWNLMERRHEGKGMRYIKFLRNLRDIRVDLIGFESVNRHIGTDAAHVYGGFLSQLQVWCEEAAIPYEGISVTAIKKHATGKGTAKKPVMMEACRQRLGIDPGDDNEADALWILHMILEREGIEWPKCAV
jgi:Holliday junction resolvasome RuvABC endonuclease subunit